MVAAYLLLGDVLANIGFHLDYSHVNVWPEYFYLPIGGLIVISLNFLAREATLISIALPLSFFWSRCRALYILFFLDKLMHIVTDSSYVLWYFRGRPGMLLRLRLLRKVYSEYSYRRFCREPIEIKSQPS